MLQSFKSGRLASLGANTVPLLFLVLLLAVLVWLVALRWPQRLSVAAGRGVVSGAAQSVGAAGEHEVLLNILPAIGDNGRVQMRVVVDGRIAGLIDSFTNARFLRRFPTGTTYRWWIDSDWRPDVVITTTHDPPQRYFVSSINGKAYPMSAANQ